MFAGANLDGASVYQALEQQKCDGTAGVPTVFLNLLEYMAVEKKRLRHLKLMTVGGAACPPRIIENFMRYRNMQFFPFSSNSGLRPAGTIH